MKLFISAMGVLAFRGSSTLAHSRLIQQQSGRALNALPARFAPAAHRAVGAREAAR